MKTPSSLLRITGNAAWFALCLVTVWHFRIHVSSLLAQAAHPQNEALAEASRARLPKDDAFATKLSHAALDRTKHVVRYDGAYLKIPYPNGDVPEDTGVCTDEIIRAYRTHGVDLQKLVHEDMARNFSAYPHEWGLNKPDANIDHRRVPNLQTYFKRHGTSLPVTNKPDDYLPGDLITCTVPPHLPHIGIVVPSPNGGETPWVVHNIGQGPQLEDRLFEFPLTGHYRYAPRASQQVQQ